MIPRGRGYPNECGPPTAATHGKAHMNRITTILTGCTLGTAILLSGCGKDDSEPRPSATPNTVTGSDVQREAREAADTARAYASEEIERYKTAMREQVSKVNDQIRTLETRARELQGQARTDVENAVQELKKSRDAFQARLGELAGTTADAWGDVKRGLDAAWNDLRKATEDAVQRYTADTPPS